MGCSTDNQKCYTAATRVDTSLHASTRGYTAAYTRRHEAPLRATSLGRIFPQRSAEIRGPKKTFKSRRKSGRRKCLAKPNGKLANLSPNPKKIRREPGDPQKIRRVPQRSADLPKKIKTKTYCKTYPKP